MRKRILVTAILVSFLWIIGNAITAYFVQQVQTTYARALVENVSTIRAAWAMQDALWRLQAVVMELEERNPRETRLEIAELEAILDRRLSEVEASSFTDKEKVLSRAVREHYGLYRDHIHTRLQTAGPNGQFVANAAQDEKTMRLAREVAEPCRELVDLNEQMLAVAALRGERLFSYTGLLRSSFLLAGPIVGLLCGVWLARGLHRSIAQISVTLKDAVTDVDHDVGSVEVRERGDLTGLHNQAQVVANRIRQVWKQLQDTRRQAMSAERLAAVGELAAGVAHELRNPLTSVKLLIQTAIPQESHFLLDNESFHVVEQEIARMENSIRELLDFARPPELRRVPHDLRRTVQRALNLIEGRAKRQNITITVECPDKPVLVNGDPEQLHQVFINLLLNGVEAMPEGGTLRVAICSDVGPGGRCRVIVSDSGVGISREVFPRIFEPFVTSKERGTGLGLAVSQRIAKEHGGLVRAANRPRGGAVFALELPTRNEDAVASSAELAEAQAEWLAVCVSSTGDHLEAVDAKTSGD